jgi:L-threonylcarbamoyladenylate synthase
MTDNKRTTSEASSTTSPFASLEAAVEALKQGNVVGMPTETVYGLAAKISDSGAIRKIFSTKNRPFFDPLIVHVTSVEQAKALVKDWPPSAQMLADNFWPGPLTLVLPKKDLVSDLITSGLETVAIRFPRHPVAHSLISTLGEPVAAPSANKFGRTSPSQAIHVVEEFNGEILVMDGGPCEVGIESTIVKIKETTSKIELTILRAGTLLPEQLRTALKGYTKEVVILQPGRNIEAPGQIKHHYMPTIPVLFVARSHWDKNQGQFPGFFHPCQLQLSNSPEQAARELYGQLRQCSVAPNDLIVFVREDYHQGEAWTAILDRLNRAATYHLTD